MLLVITAKRFFIDGDRKTKKGWDAEEVVRQACFELKKERKISSYWGTGNYPGIDFLIFAKGKLFPIEVKSSWNNVEEHNLLHRNIPFLVVYLKKPCPASTSLFRKKVRQAKERICNLLQEQGAKIKIS